MPELRKDPILGRWVIISAERARRPRSTISRKFVTLKEERCNLCSGNEELTAPEVYALRRSGYNPNASDWDVRVVPNSSPFLRIEGEIDRRGKGLYDVMNGIGAHEIVIESPDHIHCLADLPNEQISKVIKCFKARITDLEKDPRFKYVLVFKNYNSIHDVDAIQHSHSQMIATPITPRRVKEELIGSKRYYELHERCVFCDMIKYETHKGARVVLDEEDFLVITPFASRIPFELWVLPKDHSCNFHQLDDKKDISLASTIKKALLKIKVGLDDPSFNMIIHTAPFRKEKLGYWLTIEEDYHWHIEIVPRITSLAGFEWGTGFYICPIPPEDAAEYLKGVKI